MKLTVKFTALDGEAIKFLEDSLADVQHTIVNFGDSTVLDVECGMQKAVFVMRLVSCYEHYEVYLHQ